MPRTCTLFLSFLFLSLSPFLSAQSVDTYSPAAFSSEENFAKEVSAIEARLSSDESGIKNDKALQKVEEKKIIELYENRSNTILFQIKEGHFLADSRIHKVVQKTFSNVLKANPDLPKEELRLFVSRESWPNASCFGEGSLVINIGLLARLENESQLAFVICHEMAHYVQNHVNKRIKDRITYLYSKETQAELKKIAKSDYGQYTKMQKMFGASLYSSRRHDRSRELEADSIGLFFLQNTPYDVKEAINTLLLLDKVDKPKYLADIDIKAHFDGEGSPFEEEWLAVERDVFIKGEKVNVWDIDSLKTHPSCKKRYGLVEHRAVGEKAAFLQPVSTFVHMVRSAEFEIIESYYFFGHYGRCLHECLQYLEEYPYNAYLHARIVACLHHIWVAKQDHEFGKVVAIPDEDQTPTYEVLNTMLHEMTMSDYRKLATFYFEKHKSAYLPDEHFVYANILVAEMHDDTETMEKAKGVYKDMYPKGQYAEELFETEDE